MIDKLMYRLITPDDTVKQFSDHEEGRRYAEIYAAYEQELRRLNALDFNSLLLQTYRLLTEYPAIAERYRRAYPYWLIDEFQDTNTAQYRLIRALTGTTFKSVFMVADDDQIIYEWNGANYKQLERFRKDFAPKEMQLPTNYRCPATIITAANKLVQYNSSRTPNKTPLVAAKERNEFPDDEHIRVVGYDNEGDEVAGIATTIWESGQATWGHTIVLARNRSLLDALLPYLKNAGVPTVIAQRRDNFLTPEFRWLQFSLRQVVRPSTRRTSSSSSTRTIKWLASTSPPNSSSSTQNSKDATTSPSGPTRCYRTSTASQQARSLQGYASDPIRIPALSDTSSSNSARPSHRKTLMATSRMIARRGKNSASR